MIQIDGPAVRVPRPPAPEPLTFDAFARLVETVPLELAAWCHRRRFPRGPASRVLSDDARGRLWAEIDRAYRAGQTGLARPGDPFPIHLVQQQEV